MEATPGEDQSMLIVMWLRLMRTMIKGAQQDPHFRALAVTAVSLVVIGTAFFSINQGWSLVDSFYFSVTTLTTVGFGDLAPTGNGAKLATVAYELAGIGVFVLLLSQLAQRTLEGRRSDTSEPDGDSAPAG